MVTQKEIETAIQGLKVENEKTRDRIFQILVPVSNQSPERLYPYWDFFADILRTGKILSKHYAIHILANLLLADSENKFKTIFKEYIGLLSHESPVVACHIAICSAKIVEAKPDLESKITNRLLDIDNISQCKQHELLKSYVIEAFDQYYGRIKHPKKVIAFVQNQRESDSPKTRKKAKEFMEKWASS